MEINVSVSDLSRELSLLEKIVGRKPTIAVLANVLITAIDDMIVLSATDLEIGLVGVCPAEVLDPGSVTLPARKLMELVRAQSGREVTMKSAARGAVQFSSGGFKSRLQALPPQDFPKIPSMDGLDTLELPREFFGAMIDQTRYAISDKERRFYMSGVCMKFDEGKMTFVSTDSKRISVTEVAREGPVWESVLVPSKALDELVALCGEDAKEDIVFAQTERHLFFNVDGRLLISRRIDGQFPTYEQMIPKTYQYTPQLDRELLTGAVRRVALIDNIIVIRLQEDRLELWAASQEVGDGDESVEMTGYKGPRMELKFNAQFLLDFLTTALGDKITLAVQDEAKPLLLTDGGYLNVIMGMRT